jgi:hypothetical protein
VTINGDVAYAWGKWGAALLKHEILLLGCLKINSTEKKQENLSLLHVFF